MCEGNNAESEETKKKRWKEREGREREWARNHFYYVYGRTRRARSTKAQPILLVRLFSRFVVGCLGLSWYELEHNDNNKIVWATRDKSYGHTQHTTSLLTPPTKATMGERADQSNTQRIFARAPTWFFCIIDNKMPLSWIVKLCQPLLEVCLCNCYHSVPHRAHSLLDSNPPIALLLYIGACLSHWKEFLHLCRVSSRHLIGHHIVHGMDSSTRHIIQLTNDFARVSTHVGNIN